MGAWNRDFRVYFRSELSSDYIDQVGLSLLGWRYTLLECSCIPPIVRRTGLYIRFDYSNRSYHTFASAFCLMPIDDAFLSVSTGRNSLHGMLTRSQALIKVSLTRSAVKLSMGHRYLHTSYTATIFIVRARTNGTVGMSDMLYHFGLWLPTCFSRELLM
jgi:hypothetical protein